MCPSVINILLSLWFVEGYLLPREIHVNSLRPSDAYIHQQTQSPPVQIMVCRLFAPSHYPNQCGYIVNWTNGNKLQWNFNGNLYIFIQENAFETVVCEEAAILSRGRWVNYITWNYHDVEQILWVLSGHLVKSCCLTDLEYMLPSLKM